MVVRVLLVEDQKPTQVLVTDMLEHLGGFELVKVAADETTATDWLMKHRGEWDLAILDLMLQHGSGFTLISRCSHEPGTVLVFSDFVTPVVRKRCLRLGADDVLSKASFPDLRVYLESFRRRMQQAAAA